VSRFDPVKAAKILALVLGSSSASERASARAMLDRLLHAHRIDGRDLLPRYALDRLDDATRARVNDLLHPLWTCDDDAQREHHRILIERRLTRWRMSWHDLVEQITALDGRTRTLCSGSGNAAAWYWLLDDTGTALVVSEEVSISILDEISYLIGQYIALDPDQLTVATLWIAHTHIFDRYMCSPRLAVCGPMPNLGKTTMMDVLSRLVRRAVACGVSYGSRALLRHARQSHHDADRRDALCRSARAPRGDPACWLPPGDADPARQEVDRCLLRRGVRVHR
jgi:hypothetical protein